MHFVKNFIVILFDIGGTITSISFVKDKLFGYVRENVRNYLNQKFDEEVVQSDIKDLLEESKEVKNNFDLKTINKSEVIRQVEEIVIRLMDGDKKFSSLQKLQGHMFEDAFQSKSVTTEFFPDVLKSIRRLKDLNKRVCIYSSGSVFAQKLLFSHTSEGDITHLITSFYDTTTGSKVETDSYKNICSSEKVEPGEVLFLTDMMNEAVPARIAGCGVVVVLREGNLPISEEERNSFKSFNSLEELFT